MRMSEWQKEELRRCNWICKACGADLTVEPWHADHIHPKSRGGSKRLSNYQIFCHRCNCSKKDKTMAEWKPWLIKEGSVISSWEQLDGISYEERFKQPDIISKEEHVILLSRRNSLYRINRRSS